LTNCPKCLTLREKYRSQVSFFNEKSYRSELSLFWSLQQSQTFPACIFLPKSSQDVASAVLLSRKTNCPFAVKSGGHAAFAGASNIAAGITIDLAWLNEITVNEDRDTVSISPGNKWVDVYRELEQKNLTVAGGRIADVGVGGLTLGGGISFFSNMHGWVCDNVASYEVVTASGGIINASSHSHEDLYWALRGGGNNFGLVTKFEMLSYPHDQGLMWVGKVRNSGAQNASLIQAFVDFGANGTDPKATLLFSILYLQKQDQFLCVSELDYAEPVPNETHPPVFDPFFNVGDSLQVTMQTKTVVEVIEEHSASNPNGLRQSYWTATFRLDRALAQDILDLWMQEVDPIKKRVAGFVPVLTFQVITMPMIQHMGDRGGNALGLEDEHAPLMLVVPSAMWTDAADDEVIFAAYTKWLAESRARAKVLGLDHRYLYMNYASQFQDPIRGYGDLNTAKLKKIARRYDPDEVFQRLQPGYFKL
jgi:FAD binding domain